GISAFYEMQWPGIISQAVLATLSVVGVTLALFASGKVRASAKATKVFLIAMVGYLLFSVINVFVMIFGGADANPWGLRGSVELFGIPLGLILGVFAVLLGAYSLVLDFDFIQKGVQNRIPKKYQWTGAFGIMVTVIWLYTEILRLLAIARR
ncbi:Bax inhibitor-1/YccA family protein, partial [Schumannella luteola]